MPCPKISLQLKSNIMKKTETKYVKRTQKDHSMSFKLSVVQEFGTIKISLEALKRKYGIQGNSTIRG